MMMGGFEADDVIWQRSRLVKDAICSNSAISKCGKRRPHFNLMFSLTGT